MSTTTARRFYLASDDDDAFMHRPLASCFLVIPNSRHGR